MTNSREKFKAFWDHITDTGWTGSEDLAEQAFKAGRESMRDEAATLLQDGPASWLAHHEASQLVAGIEP